MEIVYQIKYRYQTGDSFHTENLEDVLEFDWKNLDVVKECLNRMKEHYRWYKSIESYGRMQREKKPHWHKVNTKYNEHYLINLPMDNGNEVQISAPWCGYFESLYGAEIITKGDTDMKFEIE
jgi:hypothetical protein